MATVVLAYSGGLDTSVAIRWIKEKYDLDVIALTIDVGNERDLSAISARALQIGAVKSLVVDGRADFVRYFVWPALQAGAIYEGQYPLATALARPLIARLLVEIAHNEGAVAIAHGCTGKGNDQVRFDVSINTLAPDLKIIAPVREWSMTRDNEIAYAAERGIPIQATNASPYSVDQNLWGRSVECGILEDPWAEPPEEVYAWTENPDMTAGLEPAYLEITFQHGIPIALNGEEVDGVTLIESLNKQAGHYGIGRIDHIENRLVGIKSREVYEAPAATVLHAAHNALETLTLGRDQVRFKEIVASKYARLIYNGQWYSALHQDLAAYIQSTQRFVSGTIRMKISRGHCAIVGRKSEHSLYDHGLATYNIGDQFDHNAALGFIKLWSLPLSTQAQAQLLPSIGIEGNLLNNDNSNTKMQIAQNSMINTLNIFEDEEMPQAEITIREARVEDSYAIAAILHDLGWFEQVTSEAPALTQANIAERLAQCRVEKSHTVLVAERSYSVLPGNIVGYVSVHWYAHLALGNNGYISELFIHPSETGKGIGGRLLDSIKEYAVQRECSRLLLMNRRIRESYRRGFYAKHGWNEQQDGAFFTFNLSDQSA